MPKRIMHGNSEGMCQIMSILGLKPGDGVIAFTLEASCDKIATVTLFKEVNEEPLTVPVVKRFVLHPIEGQS